MTWAGWMRRWASLWRCGGFPGLTNGLCWFVSSGCGSFLGALSIGPMSDGRHHGEGEHDERDVTMPAMPGPGFVVVEPELVLGGLEAVFDRPAMAFDATRVWMPVPPGHHVVK